MTKKHFQLLADYLKAAREACEQSPRDSAKTAEAMIHAVAMACRASNPRFDLDRFLTACGVES